MTDRQQAIIDFIKQHVKDNGYPPTVREIGDAEGILSTSTVHGHLDRMKKKGLLQWKDGISRTLRVVQPGRG